MSAITTTLLLHELGSNVVVIADISLLLELSVKTIFKKKILPPYFSLGASCATGYRDRSPWYCWLANGYPKHEMHRRRLFWL